MKYFAIINSPYINFFEENNVFLFSVKKKTKLFSRGVKRFVKIVDINENNLLELEYEKSFFGKEKCELLTHNLGKNIEIKVDGEEPELFFENKKINIRSKRKFIGRYEGEFLIDDETIGKINRGKGFFLPVPFNFKFHTSSDINFYCLILFALLFLDFQDGE